jgi:hypothetical protein
MRRNFGCDGRRTVKEIAAYAKLVEPRIRRTDGQSKAEDRVHDGHYVEIPLAGINRSENDSCEEGEYG